MPTDRVESIPACEAIRLLMSGEEARCVDVRSEGEFLQASIPTFQNIPILSNEERHQVGCVYKSLGQTAAIELGHSLVLGHRDFLVQRWRETLVGAEWPLLACFRGGLRSEIAADWLRESGTSVIRIEGGYKRLRFEFQKSLAAVPELLLLTGATGSGKTQLLRGSLVPQLNLEEIARHRGSAFGGFAGVAQPSQATFENETAFQLMKLNAPRLLVEDESLRIGKVQIPPELWAKMKGSPVVRLELDMATRAQAIYRDYVADPIEAGMDPTALFAQYEASLWRIKPRLGGQLYDQIRQLMRSAFADANTENHRLWIQDLLLNYYDKMYAYGVAKLDRPVAFEGDWHECLHWIQKQFA